MIQVKKLIICMTIVMIHLCNFYSLHSYPTDPSLSHQYIWPDNSTNHNSFTNTLLELVPRINRKQSLQDAQNVFNILRSISQPIHCEKYSILSLPHDYALIEKICADNLHYDQKKLVSKLAHHKHINQMSSYLKSSDEFLYTLDENIIIDLEHFKALPYAQKRINDYVEVANEIMKKRQIKELNALKPAYDKAKKNKSKEQSKIIKKQYEQDEKKLKAVHRQELNQGAFVTAQKKVQANCIKQYHRNMLCNMVDRNEQATKLKNNVALNHELFLETIQARDTAISLSLQNLAPSSTTYVLNHQTSGYLQAHNINPQAFTATNGIAIQHQFTQELISVLDSVATHALQHPHETFHRDIALYCAQLASLTQQTNSVENLIQVEQGVNCCRGIDHFMQGISTPDHENREKQLTTALDFCAAVARGSLKGAATAAGMALAPTATGIILGAASVATAVHIGMLCGQGLVSACTLGSYYVHGQYDKVDAYLQKTYQAMTNLENIEDAAAYASGFLTAYKGLPALQNFQKSLGVQPVIATLEQASGQVSRSLWFLTAAQVEEELIATQKILELPEFKNFNLTCQELLGFKIFNLRPQSDPKLAPLLQLADMHGIIGPKDQVTLGQIFISSSNNAVQGAISSVFAGSDSEFFTTEVGKKMYLAMTKPHEQNKLNKIAKDYQTLQSNNTP